MSDFEQCLGKQLPVVVDGDKTPNVMTSGVLEKVCILMLILYTHTNSRYLFLVYP
jgi:hypothetical protein